MTTEGAAAAVEFEKVSFAFDDLVVLREVSFRIPQGGMTILLGASGSGKSVILKLILGLLRADSGAIFVHGECIDRMSEADLRHRRGDIGMLFQSSALFDSLTVAENVGYRLIEEMAMPASQARSRVDQVLGFIGLGEYADRMPSELWRSAPARGDRPGGRCETAAVAVRRPDHGSRPCHCDDG
jgi:phospholipid/cholesterol/gamma-HCH transport system ATP-binding protein